jgi:integrase
LRPTHRESPVRRTNPSGRVVWYARYTDSRGRRRSAGTFALKGEAQEAIDKVYRRVENPETLGAYFETWTSRHPRSKRTNDTNEHRISRLLEVDVEGRELQDWPLADLRRRHALALIDHMLRVQGRTTTGAVGILRSLSAMSEDAMTDEITDINPFRGLRIRANDPRAKKQPRQIRVFAFEQMHAFAAVAAKRWEPMIRTFSDTGMRLGEVLALERGDLVKNVFRVGRTAHEGKILGGTKTDHGEPSAGREVPCPPGLADLIKTMPRRIDTRLLFPTPRGRLWRERNFYRDVWKPTQEASGMDIRPHEMRHSFVTHLRAAGIDDADLAAMAGHRVETMLSKYTHALGLSFDRVRQVIG